MSSGRPSGVVGVGVKAETWAGASVMDACRAMQRGMEMYLHQLLVMETSLELRHEGFFASN